MSSKLIIHAVNIHNGGGNSLLSALLAECPKDLQIVALLDKRMKLPSSIPENLTVEFIAPTIFQRLRAEWWLKKNIGPHDSVLCFGNLPPLFKLLGNVVLFVQNRYLIEPYALCGFDIKIRIRLVIERFWFAMKSKNADDFIVQTPSMKMMLQSSGCLGKQPIYIKPFVYTTTGYWQKIKNNDDDEKEQKKYNFIYVASGEPHKNHKRLIEAWCLLAEQELFPSLCLTLDVNSSGELCDWIEKQKMLFGLNIHNIGLIPHSKILQLYTQVQALIYPSLFESFGLPLIEANQVDLPVLASELDYVRDLLDPEQTFNPESSISITRAVKRFMEEDESPLLLLTASEFISDILNIKK